jgi:7-cyano-7-deazaguanine synthase in queuosine biosynthesis
MALVCWSGGCDSTLVLWSLLLEQKVSEPVRTITVNHNWVGAYKEQRQAREKLSAEFRKRGYRLKSWEVKVTAPPYRIARVVCNGLSQPLFWLANAVPYLEDGETLSVGYIRSDDAFHKIGYLVRIFNDACAVFGKHDCKLAYPLEYVTKAEVIDKLEQAKLFRYCWTCSTPAKGKPCGRCKECITQEVAQYERKLREEKGI